MSRRYLLTGLSLCIGLLTLISLFNYWRDPYGLFHPEDGRNRPDINSHVRLYKAWAVERLEPDALILGTSRSDVGLSPAHPAFDGYRAYNLALGGASIYELLRYYQHARAVRIPKRLVLGLDLISFHAARPEQADFAEYRLKGPEIRWQLPLDYASALLSFASLNASLHSFTPAEAPAPYLANGQRNPERVAWQIQRDGGTARAFEQIEQGQLPRCFQSNRRRFQSDRRPVFSYLEQLLAQAYADGTEVKLVISPYHARMALTNAAMDDELLHRIWLGRVLSINETQAAVAGKTPFELWDFSGFNAYTTEPVSESMQYYWESSHYQSRLGDKLLSRIYQLPDADPGFGQRVSLNQLGPYWQQRQQQFNAYQHQANADALAIQRLIQQQRCAQSPIQE